MQNTILLMKKVLTNVLILSL